MEESKEPQGVDIDRICPICSDIAPKSDPHRIHYGARCCLGCRAFFRRIHQKDTVPNYKCKSNNACVITPKSKQLCKKCRHEKCLSIGMNPKHVLSDGERKQRFKNLFKKIEEKQRQKTQVVQPTFPHKKLRGNNKLSATSSKRTSTVQQKPRKILPKDFISSPTYLEPKGNTVVLQDKSYPCSNVSQAALIGYNEKRTFQQFSYEPGTAIAVRTPSDLTTTPNSEAGKKLSTILDSFTFSMLRVESSTHASEIISHHLKTASLRKTSLILHLGHIASAFTDFARSIPTFRNLSCDTKRILLRNNVPLYIQYVLARYFNSSSGLEQLNWILEGQLSVVSLDIISSLVLVDFTDFNCKENLLAVVEAEIGYSEIGKIIQEHFQFPQHFNGLVAYLLLFNIDINHDDIEVDNLDLVRNEFNTAKYLLCSSFNDFQWSSEKIHMLFSHLGTMKRIFDQCQIDSNLNSYNVMPDSIVEKFSEAEDIWLQIKLKKFNEYFSSVSLPQKMIFSIINYTQNKSSFQFKEMTPTCIAIITERVRRCQKIHPEFERLKDLDQEALWAQNHVSAIALAGLKVNLFQRGKDQLRFSMGYVDPYDPEWMRQIQGRTDLENLDVAYIYNNDLNYGRLDEKSASFIKTMLDELSHLLQPDEVFQLFTILALLDTTGLPYRPTLEPIFRLRQVILKLFFRKVSSQTKAAIDYFAFGRTLGKIRDFGTILIKNLSV